MNKYQRKNIFKLCKGMICRLRERQSPGFLAIFCTCRIHNDLERENLEKPNSSRGCTFSRALWLARTMESWASKVHWKVFTEAKIPQRYKHFRYHFSFFLERSVSVICHFPRHGEPAACVLLLVLRLLRGMQKGARLWGRYLYASCVTKPLATKASSCQYSASAGQLLKTG